MPQQLLNLIKGDRISSKTDYRDALPVNMTGVARPILKAAGYMLQHPGLTQYATGAGIDRGGIWNERHKEHYRVSGGSLIKVDADGALTILGAISGTGTASLPYSFNTQGIVADGKFWRYSSSIGLVEVVDPDLGSPIDCVWTNGRYFFTDGDFIYHTDLADEASIDPLKFATAEFMPDDSLGVAKTEDNKVIVFGRYTTEYFVDQANENFAYSRVETRAIKIGIVGTHCKAEVAGRWYILGGRKEEAVSIHSIGVGTAAKVASREVDKILGLYNEDDLATAVLESRDEDGYSFLLVHLPDHTLLFNQTLAATVGIDSAWSIVKSDITGDLPWRGKHGVYEPRKGVWVYGDKRDSKIGILDDAVSTQYGDMVEWILYTPFVYLETASIDELDVETIPGHNATLDATVAVSLTYDGVTYGTEYFQLYGVPGDYSTNFILRRMGVVNDWFGLKMRGVSRSRMAFAGAVITYG